MIDYETVLFIDMMNKIASEYDEKSKFIAINPQNYTEEEWLTCKVLGHFAYDCTKVAGTDLYVKFYPAIHKLTKTGEVIYYPHTFIGVADDNKKEPDEPKYCIFTFPQEDFDWDTVIGYTKGKNEWRSMEYII